MCAYAYGSFSFVRYAYFQERRDLLAYPGAAYEGKDGMTIGSERTTLWR